ncbi:hypothetical protein [uncultured Bartonella sp.]|uniref:hypothetical protein n=1 Tax=uncultured Bartonella sp. TaxID=104108 RepID=UPI0025FC7614|nr:hypothetical protein [uncultured Bartonella sp.]
MSIFRRLLLNVFGFANDKFLKGRKKAMLNENATHHYRSNYLVKRASAQNQEWLLHEHKKHYPKKALFICETNAKTSFFIAKNNHLALTKVECVAFSVCKRMTFTANAP